MTTWMWFAIGVGAAAWIVCWRYLAGHLAWYLADYSTPEAPAICGAVALGFFGAFLVPFIFAVEYLGKRELHYDLQRVMLTRALHLPARKREEIWRLDREHS